MLLKEEKIKEYKNFLPNDIFKTLKDTMMGDNFPWYFNDFTIAPGGSGYQFTHTFLSGTGNGISSDFLSILHPIIDKLKLEKVVRIKANLNPQTSIFNKGTGWHIDTNPPKLDQKTAIYYINTNNGYTQFKWRRKVKSIENRLVIFDATTKLCGFTCTDKKSRVLVNYNYY